MLRPAEFKDIKGIRNLLLQVLAVHNAGRPDIFKPVGYKYTEEQLAEIINDNGKPVFVFTDENDKVLGHCFCIINEIMESEAVPHYKSLYIDDLCVDEAHRKQHIGKQLYDYVKRYAQENGIYNITLHAWECNPSAVEFYKNLGLTVQQYTFEEII